MADNLIGESPYFLSVLDKVSQLAPINRPVLVIGERGTGKELIAHRLHYLSTRWDQPLVSLNCSTLSEGLIDSELFGHESGSFTGAKGRHQGRFERAENGTLFLDELATTPLAVQEKLLRVIEYGQYERVGGSQTLEANVRLVCATNEDLPELAKQGLFRADLLDRLAFDVIHIPPLRHRQQDIALLAQHFAIKMCRELALPLFVGFAESAWQQMLEYPWPGNIRELKNVVERAIYLHGRNPDPIEHMILDPFKAPFDSELMTTNRHTESSHHVDSSHHTESDNPKDTIQTHDTDANPLNIEFTAPAFPLNFKAWQQEQDIQLLKLALLETQYNQRETAKLLSLSYDQLRGMVRKYQLV
ncbi:phage shock protein operon transcriptional activator [Vibrio hippocampi]|uniref:Psp operon transcriptional activator n=1 Tax=Vibrio hippocampi TaxID=654686 RepID=A0ABM8ZIJ4_9VIBR|nr:phage shock protein operon transcriptional activator [Vibrio hippocampi]CAH0525714.1 Psp operon transcriptional activator [Vibrio hippocampi]